MQPMNELPTIQTPRIGETWRYSQPITPIVDRNGETVVISSHLYGTRVSVLEIQREIMDDSKLVVQFENLDLDLLGLMYFEHFIEIMEYVEGPERPRCTECGTADSIIVEITCISCSDPDCKHPKLQLCMRHQYERIIETLTINGILPPMPMVAVSLGDILRTHIPDLDDDDDC